MSNGIVDYQQQHGIAEIRFNRPDKRNALTQAMYQSIVGYLREAESNPDVRCVIFAGEGEHFCAGNDLGDFLNSPPIDEQSPVIQLLFTLAQAKKPLIAAVEGFAVGIGTTLLLHCDFAYAGNDAKFSLPFVNLALVPEAASSLLLPKLSGYTRAAELLLLGEAFSPEKALQAGLLTQITPRAEALTMARETAAKLAAKPPAALRASKALMKRTMLAPVEEAIRAEVDVFAKCLQSPEAKEAFQAFLEKRAPNFSQFR